ncbi:LysR family transcriptional regulator [Croceicoccus ponticola]|uniref:LysR family transcriptional regulator n=1 Tax=Croceicoccus ponticola TaxID=2217664 RepID=A0A437H124_9SPHN|nr:LysR family transcriptional regulator [Croceicoccus ponticola]RVQ69347.1 LysR family transcriptional regulator [Croceicoccus ponticola]
MIKRSHIRQFLAVVETGSFTQAAGRIRVTQPTLSAGIADLERMVGSRLFVRDRRHVRLTEAGGRFLPLARELDRNFRAVDGFGVKQASDWPALKLGVIRSVAAPVLETVVAALGKAFSIEMVEGSDSELRAALASGRVDMMLGLLRPEDKDDGAIALVTEPYVMFVPDAHSLAAEESVEPERLASEIMIARRSCEILDRTSAFFTRHQVRPRFSLRSESEERCMAMVAAGLGITTAPLSHRRDGIVPIGVVGYDFARTLGLRSDPAWLSGERRDDLARIAAELAERLVWADR